MFFFFFIIVLYIFFFFFSSRRRHTRSDRDWSSDVCSSDLRRAQVTAHVHLPYMSGSQEASAQGAIDRRIGKLEELRAFQGDLEAEVEVEVRLPNGFVRGVIDGVLHEPDGRVVIRDWKT